MNYIERVLINLFSDNTFEIGATSGANQDKSVFRSLKTVYSLVSLMATRIVYRITIDKYGAVILSEFEISTVHKDMATIEC